MPVNYSGGIGLLYGVIIRDRAKTADLETLRAYKTVAQDILGENDDADLRGALKDLDAAIAQKGGK